MIKIINLKENNNVIKYKLILDNVNKEKNKNFKTKINLNKICFLNNFDKINKLV